MNHVHYRVRSPGVVSEIIDGEAVIMNLKSGNYFSTDRAGALIWDWIGQGRDRASIMAGLSAAYDADKSTIEDTTSRFIDELITQELIEVADKPGATPPASSDAPRGGRKKSFAAPALNTYSDMKDLLLLDPIHDVDEVGWPTPKTQAGGAA